MAFNTPDRDQRTFHAPSPGARLVFVCLLSIALMMLDSRNEHLRDIRRLLGAATYPVRAVVDAPFALGRWIGDSFATRATLQDENDALKRQLMIQNAQLQRLASLDAENRRLRALLDSTEKVGERVLIAEIMSVDMNPFRHRIVVNKGSNDGVYIGQAMIDADGVVGQITRDHIFSAEAILITDADHALPVELVRNRLRTIAVGTGQLDRLSLPFLPRNADVLPGDLLVTSGLGGVFPAGYPVGTIREIGADTGKEFLDVSASPAAGLNRIREVLLFWPSDESGTGAAETLSAPDAGLPADMTGGDE